MTFDKRLHEYDVSLVPRHTSIINHHMTYKVRYRFKGHATQVSHHTSMGECTAFMDTLTANGDLDLVAVVDPQGSRHEFTSYFLPQYHMHYGEEL